jgi:hypothetical protein
MQLPEGLNCDAELAALAAVLLLVCRLIAKRSIGQFLP